MAANNLAAALERTEAVLRRRPSAGLHDDAPGVARWRGGTRVVVRHANGREVETDMPLELGGTGNGVSPGWMLRAALASCTATCIAMVAAVRGVELDLLEVTAASRSDVRGLLGMAEAGGARVYPGPHHLTLSVRIAAQGVSTDALRALVANTERKAPVLTAVRDAMTVGLSIEVAN